MSGEKTEEPTSKKLRDARKKGQVVKSKEVSGTFGLLSVLLTIWAMSDLLFESIRNMLLLPAQVYNEDFEFAFKVVTTGILRDFLMLLVPLLVAAVFSSIVGNMMQFGVLFSGESIKPDIKKINPVQGMKKIFALKNLVEFFKSVIKIVFLSFVVYHVIQVTLQDMMNIPFCGTSCIMPVAGAVMKKLLIYAMSAFVIIAIFDYMFERYNFMKEQRMTKDEVKREYKEMEGNAEIKGKRKELHQEILNSAENTKNSDVVIKNPTHLAIGLHYSKASTPLPIIMVKGQGSHARFILKVAEKEGIPVLENVPLAHSLFDVDIAAYIPSELIEPVAEVFRWIEEVKEDAKYQD
ncbi:MAG: type III secretion system export apparatus subunit SctU [Candidatus Endonucleobacter sp. (ex Gigantidas childressi)]|nr:type III secretion system export apparatus subunit SctU [Candidatus Endonucleobacter sp. (ex Gigantidas childressi)]